MVRWGCEAERWETTMANDRIVLAELLAAAEDAAPVASLDMVADNLRDRFGAQDVSFLFVDVAGQQVVRVSEEAAPQRGRRADQRPWPAASTTRSCVPRSW